MGCTRCVAAARIVRAGVAATGANASGNAAGEYRDEGLAESAASLYFHLSYRRTLALGREQDRDLCWYNRLYRFGLPFSSLTIVCRSRSRLNVEFGTWFPHNLRNRARLKTSTTGKTCAF